jgi:formate dehydrogenase beta subunit
LNSPVIPIQAAPSPASTLPRKRQAPKGRQVEPGALAEVESVVGPLCGAEPPRRDLLIEALHRINDAFGQLAAPHLVALAHWMRLPVAEVFEVASFYHHFDVVKEGAGGGVAPAPSLTVRVCDGLACELAGAHDLLQRLPALLGRDVRVVAVPCIGRCDTAPAAVVHQHPVGHATAQALADAVAAGLRHDPGVPGPSLAAYRAAGGYRLLRDCVEGRRLLADVLAEVDAAGLRGLGGAGFPAARKWRAVREQPAPRLMAVNIDEGEPGTFKDRVCLEADPHRFLEGMLIAAWAAGIDAVYLYLRDEYHGCRARLQAALAELQAAPPVPLPAIELRRGAGAYICGEESAMIESIEGKRGLPRLRPPYVAQVGLFGRPTLAHNLETLFWLRELLERGGMWFAGHGRNGRHGLRRFSVSGRVREPGVKLAPAGISVMALIDEHCGGLPPGHRLYGYLPGGASGGILPASLAHLPLDFDTLQPYGCFIGSAAVIVLTTSDHHHDSAMAAARNLMRFFEHESCGQCTPCRVGTSKARALIEAPHWDTALLVELMQVMRDASICGLGQAAPNPVDCVMRYFAHELADG